MRKRKDIEWGRDVTPGHAWAAWRRDLHDEIVDSMTERRLRDGIAPPQDDAIPGG